MRWRYWLIDLPALIVTGWFVAYRVLLILATMISVTLVMGVLLSALFGLNW